jgi:hypothetical protein
MGTSRLEIAGEWASFPGSEVEGRRPRTLCAECRERLKREALSGSSSSAVIDGRRTAVICFKCYRADLARDRAIKSAAEIDTASDARFQTALPFEPVNVPRLEMLKADRIRAGERSATAAERHADRRRRAQLEARRALQAILHGVRDRRETASVRERQIAAAVHAAELQLPDAWTPFVVAR